MLPFPRRPLIRKQTVQTAKTKRLLNLSVCKCMGWAIAHTECQNRHMAYMPILG